MLLLTASIRYLFLACYSVKSTGQNQNPQAAGLPQQANGTTMVFFGGNAQPSTSSAAAATNLLAAVAVTTAVALSSLLL